MHVQQPNTLRNTVTTVATLKKTTIAMSVSSALLMSFAANAQSPAPAAAEPSKTMSEIQVFDKPLDPNPNAEVGAAYKAKTSADSRHTRPLAETPQTIAVVTKAAIDDSGFTDLKSILAAQPGITLGTGENGNAFGDRYIIRGQEARSDVFVDGLRDPGMSTRESFAIEQLEISKGPNSSFAGRGTAGGAINAITKQATLDKDFTDVSFGLGTDQYRRATVDFNKGFGDNFALRANVLYTDKEVPDRAPSTLKRNGIALSGLWEVNQDLSVILDYYGLRTKDHAPDLGYFLVGAVPNRVPATNVPVYAQLSDYLESDTDTFTARVNWKIAPDLKLTSLTRYGKTDNAFVTTGASSGTRFNGPVGPALTAPSYTAAAIDGGHTGWQEVEYFAHQSNLRWDKTIAGLKHEFIFGAEYADHKVISGNFTVTNKGAFNCRSNSLSAANNSYCLTNPDGSQVANLNNLAGRSTTRNTYNQDWRVKTIALTAMDTVDLTDRWTAFGGLRADHFDLSLVRRTPATGAITGDYGYNDTLVNGHLGLSFKVLPKLMVYGSAATAQDINGGEPDAGTSAGYGGLVLNGGSNASAKPETSVNLELGAKWNLMDDKLLATAAIFQNTKSDVMEGAPASTSPGYDPLGTLNTAKNRVRGIEFGLVGNITDKLSAQIGGAWLNSRVLKSSNPLNLNRPLSNFADRSLSAQAKYELTNAFSFGAVARYESDRCGGQPDTGAGANAASQCSQPVPSFAVYDVFAAYRFTKKIDMRVNVLNVADKDYFTAVYRSGAFLYKGDARAVRVTLNYEI